MINKTHKKNKKKKIKKTFLEVNMKHLRCKIAPYTYYKIKSKNNVLFSLKLENKKKLKIKWWKKKYCFKEEEKNKKCKNKKLNINPKLKCLK